MKEARCLKDSALLCLDTCRLLKVAREVANSSPLDPNIHPGDYKALGRDKLKSMGSLNPRRAIEEHCPRE